MTTQPFQLQPMTPADHAAVLALWSECEGVRASETPEELARILERNPGLCLVARGSGKLAGAVLCCHDGRRGYLYHLGVAPQFRRQGIASALVDRCLDQLIKLGIRRCTIFLIAGNADGEAFWRNHGWRERTDLVAFARDLPQ
jgi:ribosomal protein S18 acetylase RimI-like enzyme